jgi:DNA-binding SARP family transcriptional activator
VAAEVDYGILGPLEAVAEGRRLPLGGRAQRAILAALLLHANEAVSVDRLVDVVWRERPPATAGHALHVYVSKLRKALGAAAIGRTPSGYILRVSAGRIDLERFETLVSTARQELAGGDPARASELLREALAMWRGPALADLEFEAFARPPIMRLEELRLAAIATKVEADLALGRHEEVVPELEALVVEHPQDERLCGLRMLALYRCGRQAEALAVYQRARHRLVEELGIEPCLPLRELERKILTQDASLELEVERAQSLRSVLLVPDRRERLEELATLAEPLGRWRSPHEVILAWLEQPGPPDAVSGALAEATAELARLRAGLAERGVEARIAAFTADDRAEDILRLAGRPEIDMLILGADLSRLERGRLGPELLRILAAAPCDVAVWLERSGVSRDMREGPILVPFGALEHDWAALELGAWLAGASQRPLLLLGAAGDSQASRRDASRTLADAGLLFQRAAGVAAQPRLVEPGRRGLVEAVKEGGLLVVGLSERWAAEGLGTTRWELARSANAPVLFVRRGLRPAGISPPAGVTRYRWSVTAAA